MITEDYVSFDTAKLLKEKGFKNWCDKCYGTVLYHKGVPISFDDECELKDEGFEDEIEYVEGGYLYDFGCDNRKEYAKVYAAPTLQMTMKWLREVHNLEIYPYHNYDNSKWWVEIIKYPNSVSEYESGKDEEFDTYEEACEAAIKYCLENLI